MLKKCVNLSGGSILGNEPHPWVEKSPEADVRNIKMFYLNMFSYSARNRYICSITTIMFAYFIHLLVLSQFPVATINSPISVKTFWVI